MAATAKAAKARGSGTASVATLNNVLMQMRKNCNHPDLITSAFDGSQFLPSAKELVAQCGKMQLLDRILKKLKAGGHKVLIFSQVRILFLNDLSPRAAPTPPAFLRTPPLQACGHTGHTPCVRAEQMSAAALVCALRNARFTALTSPMLRSFSAAPTPFRRR
jgi:hypothetical protein